MQVDLIGGNRSVCYNCISRYGTSRVHVTYVVREILNSMFFISKLVASNLTTCCWRTILSQTQPYASCPRVQKWFSEQVVYKHLSQMFPNDSAFQVVWQKFLNGAENLNFTPAVKILYVQSNVFVNIIKTLRSSENFDQVLRGLGLSKAALSLVFLSAKWACTPFHFDWSEANNIAVGIANMTSMDSHVADWFFVRPDCIDMFVEYCKNKSKECQHAFGGLFCDRLKAERLRQFCLTLYNEHPDWLVYIKQKVGDMIYVPAGWIHCVITVQPCIKLAWDFVNYKHLPNYLAARRFVLQKLLDMPGFMDSQSEDYAPIPSIVKAMFTQWLPSANLENVLRMRRGTDI